MRLDKDRRTLLVLSLLPLILGSAIAVSVLGSSLIGQLIARSRAFSVAEIAVQAVVSTLLGMAVVLALFWITERGGRRGRKLVVALVVSPILGFISLFSGESLLLVMFKGSTNILMALVLLLSLAISMLSIVLIVIDVVPPTVRSAFAGFYGSVFGTFLGITMVTTSIVVIVISIAVEDYLLTRYSSAASPEQMSEPAGSDPFDYARIKSSRAGSWSRRLHNILFDSRAFGGLLSISCLGNDCHPSGFWDINQCDRTRARRSHSTGNTPTGADCALSMACAHECSCIVARSTKHLVR